MLIVLLGCVNRQPSEIFVPDYDPNLYLDALAQVDKKLESQPTNYKLLEQKLYYCQKAGWPGSCAQALEKVESVKGMDAKLFQNYLQFYDVNQLASDLIALVEDWRSQFALTLEQQQWYVKALVKESKRTEARAELHYFLNEFKGVSTYEFGAQQYLKLGDTLRAMYHLSKVRKIDEGRSSMLQYGKLLFKRGYTSRGIEVLQGYHAEDAKNQHLSLTLASFYENNGYFGLARKAVEEVSPSDSIHFYLSSLYQRDGLLDSAIAQLDSVLVKNPSQYRALKRKGFLYQQKGWLTTSLQAYEQAYKMDTTDTAISIQIEVIRRKIAYLQRRKFEENKTPLLQLESKKIENE